MDLRSFWEGSKELPAFALVLRSIILYIALIAATRMMGHRQVGILSGHNYLVAAGIVSLAAVRMVSPESSLTSGLLIVLVYALVNVLLSFLDIKWPKAIDRRSIVLMEGGRLRKRSMFDAHVTLDNLLGQLRLKGAHNLSEIDAIMLEPFGKLSVSKKPSTLPITRKQMSLHPKQVALSTVIIYDGVIDEDNLDQLGLDHTWLETELKKKGIAKPRDVFLAVLEADGTLYLSV